MMQAPAPSSFISTKTQNFLRFEFKFLLSARQRELLEHDALPHLQLDKFVDTKPEKKYFVRSLYFDDANLSSFYEKVDGIKERGKFRLRTYDTDPDRSSLTFLEIKGRYNQKVYKHRSAVTLGEAIYTDPTRALLSCSSDNEIAQRFSHHYYSRGLQPIALIDYWRRPYVDRYSETFRLTFDDSLRATLSNSLLSSTCKRNRQVLPGMSIVEIKFHHSIPRWFHHLIQKHELTRVSISKICRGLEALDIAEDV